MSFIAAVLILNMDTVDAFIAFANLLNKPCQMAFYRVDHSLVSFMSSLEVLSWAISKIVIRQDCSYAPFFFSSLDVDILWSI